MGIVINEKSGLITIDTKNTTYQMCVSEYGHLLHLYYGRKISGDMSYLLNFYDRGFSPNPSVAGDRREYTLDVLPQEYSTFGAADFRSPALVVADSEGAVAGELRFVDAKVWDKKYDLGILPSSYCEDDSVRTLKVTLEDPVLGLVVELLYGVFEDDDIITRSAVVRNIGDSVLTIKKAASLSLDMSYGKYELIHLQGRYGKERMEERVGLNHGATVLLSRRGISSHQENPFLALVNEHTDEYHGDAYGFNLVYSGSFKNEIEVDPYNQTRLVMGVSDEQFEYELEADDVFVAPEAIMTFSDAGLSGMSQNMHRFIRNNICRGKYKLSQRPVLINNWEATYFDFDGNKLKSIAKKASELGVDLFVLDDGWFGKRNSDKSGLGDWFVNREKLNGSLKDVADEIRSYGMKFGLWIEPEMVSEDSDLFREHSDYAFTIPGRAPAHGRCQLVLDYTRAEVVDIIFERISKVIDDTGVDYLKIDMNRSINEVYSLGADNQSRGKLLYDYVLGMYDFMRRLTDRYPDIMIEGCCGGGGRFDLGMLCFVPQIWCSDNTDAIERLEIQHGTSIAYPMSTIGAHVSIVPNHQTKRITPLKTRGNVAMCGGFGYELDLNLLSDEEKEAVKSQIKTYKEDWKTIQQGSYYRLNNPVTDRACVAWQYVSEDKSEAILTVCVHRVEFNAPIPHLKLHGLKEDAVYLLKETNQRITGSALMNGGIQVPVFMECEYDSMMIHMKEC